MKRKSTLWIVAFVLTLGLVLLTSKLVISQPTKVAQGMMCGGMMNGGMMGGDMGIVHQLFANHNQIHRTVKEVPGGIRAVTESDNPEVAALIQQHVASMYQRVAQGRNFSMMSRTLPIMFANANRYQRQLANISKGVTIVETAKNPDMVAVIREHGQEVSGFVANGMSAMCGGMMR